MLLIVKDKKQEGRISIGADEWGDIFGGKLNVFLCILMLLLSLSYAQLRGNFAARPIPRPRESMKSVCERSRPGYARRISIEDVGRLEMGHNMHFSIFVFRAHQLPVLVYSPLHTPTGYFILDAAGIVGVCCF